MNKKKEKKVLLVSYYYPPINNSGTQRVSSWVKYLPESGFSPVVLTTKLFVNNEFLDNSVVNRAFDLQKLLANSKDQATGFSTASSIGMKSNIKHWLFWPDTKVLWLPFAFIKALMVVRREKVNYILVTFPPASSLVVGLWLKYFTGKYFIADFRDSWIHDPLDIKLRKGLKRKLLFRLEKIIVKKADLILTTSPDSLRYYSKLAGSQKIKVKLLTNGYNEKDFKFAERKLPDFKKTLDFDPKDYFLISHVGALANSHPDNTPKYFYRALKTLLKRHPEWRKKIKVVMVGNLTQKEKAMPTKFGLEDLVLVKDQVPHFEAIAWRLISDLLLVVDAPKPKKERSSYIHGKIFEHLRSQKPILALVPAGSARDFIKKHKAGTCLKPDIIDRMVEVLEDMLAQGKGQVTQNYRQFSRKKLTRQLGDWLEDLN